MKKWVSEEIGNDYMHWNAEHILLGAGTGKGKTTFILEKYCPWLAAQEKTILYLCNRTSLYSQIMDTVKRNHLEKYITVMTYQLLQELLLQGKMIPNYDVYICDEAHYFISDSTFNLYTDISFDYIIQRFNSVVIWITATFGTVFEVVRHELRAFCEEWSEPYQEPKLYHLQSDYSHVNQICWFKKHDLLSIFDEIENEPDSKIIYFCNSIKRMQEIYDYYLYSSDESHLTVDDFSFYCSKNQLEKNPWAKEHCDLSSIYYTQEHGYSFATKVLVSTKCLDNGVDFKDTAIKHIICDIFDLESAIQCLGRKRAIDDTDKCTFYIRDYQLKEMHFFESQNREEMKSVDLFLHSYDDWIGKYGNDRQHLDKTIFYDHSDEQWKINKLRYAKLYNDFILYDLVFGGEETYRSLLEGYFPASLVKRSYTMQSVHENTKKDAICRFLMKYEGQLLNKEIQNELIELCQITDKYGRKQKQVRIISLYLQDNYGYVVNSKIKKISGKSVRGWLLEREEQ